MINKVTVEGIAQEWLKDKDYFLVDVTVGPDNKIGVEIDHQDGVWIDDCVQLSRYIEEHLSRDEEDYELEVGSAGLGQPFKVQRQWENHVGKQVEILTADGRKVRGTLTAVTTDAATLAVPTKVTIEGRKRPVVQDVETTFPMTEVRSGRYLIDFK